MRTFLLKIPAHLPSLWSVAPNPARVVRAVVALGALAAGLTCALPARAQDLTITKTAPANVAPGQNLKYNITFKNQGDTSARGYFYDNLPEGTTFQSIRQTAGATLEISTPAVGDGGAVSTTVGYVNFPPTQGERIQNPRVLTPLGSQIFFNGNNNDSSGNYQQGIFLTDGTPAGTRLLVPDNFLNTAAQSQGALVYNGKIYFTRNDSGKDNLYALNASGATLVKTLSTNLNGSSKLIRATSNGFYLSVRTYNANTGVTSNSLQFSDGTAAGTLALQSGGNYSNEAADVNGALGNIFFYRNNNALWRSQGTAATTIRLKNNFYLRTRILILGGSVYFAGDDQTSGFSGLYKSDGTVAGTVLIREMSNIRDLGVAGGSLYFAGSDPNTGVSGLYKSDGTAAGTVLVSSAVTPSIDPGNGPGYFVLNGAVYFIGYNQTGDQIWKTDGTAAGTTKVSSIGDGSGNIGELQLVGSTLFFRAYTVELGYELYKSDGTPAGTVIVKDIAPGDASSYPVSLTALGNKILFDAQGSAGSALFISDGTAVGTKQLNLPAPTDAVYSFEVTVKVSSTMPLTQISNKAEVYTPSDLNQDNNQSTAVTQVTNETRSLVVTTLADVVNTNDNQTSLREAVGYANELGGARNVTFAAALNGAIVLTNAQSTVELLADITINGANRISIDGSLLDANSNTGALTLRQSAKVTLRDLKLINSADYAVYAGNNSSPMGALTVNNCTFSGNQQAIYVSVPFISDASVFENNKGGFATVFCFGTATVSNSTFRNNGTAAASVGDVIQFYDAATVTNCTFSGNYSSDVVYVAGNTASFTDCLWTGNRDGTALYNGSSVTLTRGVFSQNTNPGRAGTVANYGTLTVTDSTLAGNTAFYGGAIYNAAKLTATNCTMSGNTAVSSGGAIYSQTSSPSNTTLTQCTLSGNTATQGGAIYNEVGQTTLANCTLTGNTATDSGASGGGIASNPTSGNSSTRTILSNTIAVGNSSDVDLIGNGTTSFNSSGYNLVGSGNAIARFNQPGDQRSVTVAQANLDTLRDNGGPTKTVALLAGSAAINLGDPAVTGTNQFDQRGVGFPRVQEGRLDIGAFESKIVVANGAPSVAPTIDIATPTTNQTLTVTPNGTDPENNPLTYVYTFSVNGAQKQSSSSPTFDLSVAGNGDKGQTVRVSVVANDGTNDSAPGSAQVTVINTAPSLGAVSFTPAAPTTNSSLSAAATGADDDNEALSYVYTFFVNNVQKQSGVNATFDLSQSGNGDKGDIVKASVVASDGTTNSAAKTAQVTIGNSAPSLADSSYSGATGAAVSVQLAGMDNDGDALAYTVTSGALPGGLSLSAQGKITGTPTAGGNFAATVKVSDGTATAMAQITFAISVTNTAPSVAPTLAPTNPKTNQTITVTPNGADAEGNALTYVYTFFVNNVQKQSGASDSFDLSVAANGNVGDAVKVSVVANDGALNSAAGTAQVTVANSAPTLADANFSAAKGTALNIQLNGADDDNTALTYSVTAGALPGGLSLSAQGKITGTPGVAGNFTATVRVSDGTANGSAQIAFTISNAAPSVAPTLAPANPTAAQTLTVTPNGSDANGDALTYVYTFFVNNIQKQSGASATFALSGVAVKGDIVKVSVVANDGTANSAAGVAQVTVSNSAPSVGAPTLAPANPKTNQTITATAAGTDSDGDALVYTYTFSVNNVQKQSGVSPTFDLSVAGNGNVGDIVKVSVVASDGMANSAAQTAQVTIGNSAPTLANAAFNGTVGSAFSAQLNGADDDNTALTYSVTGGALPSGLSLSSDGKITGTPTVTGNFSATVTVSDGTLTGTAQIGFTIVRGNSAPTVAPTINPANPTTKQIITVGANGNDGDGDALTYVYTFFVNNVQKQSGASNSFHLGIAGNGNVGDTVSVSVVANDGALNSAAGTAQVTVINSAPRLADASYSGATGAAVSVQLAGVDDDFSPLTYAVTAGALPGGLSLSSKGKITGTPTAGGNFAATVTVSDGTLTGTAQVRFAISVTNTAPSVAPVIAPANPTVGQTLTVTPNGSDAEGDALTYVYTFLVNNAQKQSGASATFVLAGVATKGDIVKVSVVANDGALNSAAGTAQITVANSAPSLADASYSRTQGTPLSISLAGADADGDALTYALTGGSLPDGLSLSEQGAIAGTPGTAGSFAATVRVSDGTASAIARISFTIAEATRNRAPVLSNGIFSATVNKSFSFPLVAHDADGDPLTYALSAGGSLPAGVTLSSAGIVSGVPTRVGVFGFAVTVRDGQGGTGEGRFNLTVNSNTDGVAPIMTRSDLPRTLTRDQLAALVLSGTVRDIASDGVSPSGVRRVQLQLRRNADNYAYNGRAFGPSLAPYYPVSLGAGDAAAERTYERALSFVPGARVLTPGDYSLVLVSLDKAGNYSGDSIQITIVASNPAAPSAARVAPPSGSGGSS